MYKLLKSKKGLTIEHLIPLIAFFFFVFIVILLLFVSNRNQEKIEIDDLSDLRDGIEGTDNLLVYLKSPVLVDLNFLVPEKPGLLKQITFAELITLAHQKGRYTQLNTQTKKFFNSIYLGDSSSWVLSVNTLPTGESHIIFGGQYDSFYARSRVGTAILPGIDKEIEVRLFKQTKKDENIAFEGGAP